MTQQLTYKFRLRDKHAAELNRQARAVNFIGAALTMTSTERVRKWRADNPEKARAILRGQQERESEKIQQRAMQWSRDNPERRKQIKDEYDERRRRDHNTWARHMVSAIKARCRKKLIPFNLSVDDILSAIPKDGVCPALGIPIIFGGRLSRNSPSIDRLLPSVGYVKGNIAVISHRANAMKQDASDPAELRAIADYMERGLDDCGTVHDRDVNAARNILRIGLDALVEGAPQ